MDLRKTALSQGGSRGRTFFDVLLQEFFSMSEYASVTAELLVDESNLRDDLWLDDLALLELNEFLLRKTAVVIDMDAVRTLADIRSALGPVASVPVVSKLSRVPTQRLLLGPGGSGRARWALRVGEWAPTDAEFDSVLRKVPPARRDKVLKFKFLTDQKLHLCGRLMLRRMIHEHTGLPYEDIVFGHTKGNKPFLASPLPLKCVLPNYNFNYSHEGDMVVAASEPSSIVGVDVAKVEVRSKSRSIEEHFDTMSKCFSAREWRQIRCGGTEREQLLRFFVFWSLKEAYTKATGWGLGTEFSTIEFREVQLGADLSANRRIEVAVEGRLQPNWFFRLHRLDEDHIMAVATGPPVDAAPTFKDTFKMALSDPLWQSNKQPPVEADTVTWLSIGELLDGIPDWKD